LKGHLHGAVLSVVAHDARRIRAALDGAAGVLNALLVGDGVHLVVDDAARRIPELRAALQAAGLSCDRLEEVAPTIEDLFVAATSERDGKKT
jgi:ABC-2 type transport system ATP-binding protein